MWDTETMKNRMEEPTQELYLDTEFHLEAPLPNS